ncbi:MAG: hypothetical protein V4510_10970 [bacterium]
MNRKLLAIASLAFLGAFFIPSAEASTNPPGLTCYNYQWDSDHDGNYENWHSCGTPPCGCNCPVVGLVLEITADGQDRDVAVWASCQSGYGTGSEPSNNPESVGVLVTPVFYPAGLGPTVDRVNQILNSLYTCLPC